MMTQFLATTIAIDVMDLFTVVLLALILFWVGRIFFMVQKGLNEIVKGLNSIDERLSDLERSRK